MSDMHRSAWGWDLVWVGGEGPALAAHLAIAHHLGFSEPELVTFGPALIIDIEAEVALIQRYRCRVQLNPEAALDGRWPPRKSRDYGFGAARLWCGCVWPCREGHNNAFGPVQQPSVLVLAEDGALDGWADQARAMGVRVDVPLRGYGLDDRQAIARRICGETPAWRDVDVWAEDEAAPGWGTRREQLLALVDGFDLERVGGLNLELSGPEPDPQLGLNFWAGGTPPTSPVEPPGRRGRARGPRADGARVGGNLGLHARGGA